MYILNFKNGAAAAIRCLKLHSPACSLSISTKKSRTSPNKPFAYMSLFKSWGRKKRDIENSHGPPAVEYRHVESGLPPPTAHNTTTNSVYRELRECEQELRRERNEVRRLRDLLHEIGQEKDKLSNKIETAEIKAVQQLQEAEEELNTAIDDFQIFKKQQIGLEALLGRNIARALISEPMSPQPYHRMTSGPIPRPDQRSRTKYKIPEVAGHWVDLDGHPSFITCALYSPA